MLGTRGYSAQVLVNGVQAKEYGKDDKADANTVSCYIPSNAGETFSLEMRNNGASKVSFDVHMDGKFVSGKLASPGQTASITGVDVSDTLYRPFTFGEIHLTDDDAAMNATTWMEIGCIEVLVRRINDATTPGKPLRDHSGVLSSRAIHERSKKAGTHRVLFGPVVARTPLVTQTVKFIDTAERPFARFKFLYRPIDILRAQGIIPSSGSQAASSGGQHKRKDGRPHQSVPPPQERRLSSALPEDVVKVEKGDLSEKEKRVAALKAELEKAQAEADAARNGIKPCYVATSEFQYAESARPLYRSSQFHVPSIRRFKAEVVVNGIPLEEYGVEQLDESTVKCFIPSIADQAFEIRGWNGFIKDTVFFKVAIDGCELQSGQLCAKQMETTFKGFNVSNTAYRPFTFKPLRLTDDDGALDLSGCLKLGSIEVKVRRFKQDSKVLSVPEDDAEQMVDGPVHERCKKIGVHRVIPGSASTRDAKNFVVVDYIDPEDKPFVTFKFYYRSRDFLMAQGFKLPPSPALPASAPTSPDVIIIDDDSGVDDIDMADAPQPPAVKDEDDMDARFIEMTLQDPEVGATPSSDRAVKQELIEGGHSASSHPGPSISRAVKQEMMANDVMVLSEDTISAQERRIAEMQAELDRMRAEMQAQRMRARVKREASPIRVASGSSGKRVVVDLTRGEVD
ncbi:hypothetical protein EIP91_010968 [Steccherinum ochraceum]|uniref:DUF7918 domain-containing protein n=1 Tax=Steccherinum ochraceum TaxID=92696 RepID=A0A4R0RIC0_9APHY|nr:hypothetical protein EIP91_010968 [Steccherinum ochraceum]